MPSPLPSRAWFPSPSGQSCEVPLIPPGAPSALWTRPSTPWDLSLCPPGPSLPSGAPSFLQVKPSALWSPLGTLSPHRSGRHRREGSGEGAIPEGGASLRMCRNKNLSSVPLPPQPRESPGDPGLILHTPKLEAQNRLPWLGGGRDSLTPTQHLFWRQAS